MNAPKLFTPGPVNVSEDVRQALLHYDICHRTRAFEEMFIDSQEKINQILNADATYYSIIISGSGTAANETILSSVLKEGQGVLLIKNGTFGEKLEEIIDQYRIPKEIASSEWATSPDLNLIESILKRNPTIALVAMVFHETSTGMINPVHQVGELCVKYGKKYFVDAVSAAGGEHVDMLKNHIDFTTSVGGKCIGAFPGSAFICAREAYLKQITASQCKNVYLNLYKHYQFALVKHQTPNTPNVTLFWALNKAITNILQEGLESRISRYRNCAQIIRNGVRNAGLSLLLDKEMSNTVTSVFLPEGRNIYQFIGDLEERGFFVYLGKGKYADLGMFQIANMGEIYESDCHAFLQVLEEVLKN
ncbi:MAG: alanine--glyoxylate aminotransferase family protein [Anaerolineales bacterium]|nr:MAG: alanine--glyoxylate aminotransferase family protein [Anaerolineales bacterium]